VHWLPLLYFAGCLLAFVVSFFEREDAEFSPSALLLSLVIVAFLLRAFVRRHT
jgi:ABC-type Fe3+-siderophore transport system permease subunit